MPDPVARELMKETLENLRYARRATPASRDNPDHDKADRILSSVCAMVRRDEWTEVELRSLIEEVSGKFPQSDVDRIIEIAKSVEDEIGR